MNDVITFNFVNSKAPFELPINRLRLEGPPKDPWAWLKGVVDFEIVVENQLTKVQLHIDVIAVTRQTGHFGGAELVADVPGLASTLKAYDDLNEEANPTTITIRGREYVVLVYPFGG